MQATNSSNVSATNVVQFQINDFSSVRFLSYLRESDARKYIKKSNKTKYSKCIKKKKKLPTRRMGRDKGVG